MFMSSAGYDLVDAGFETLCQNRKSVWLWTISSYILGKMESIGSGQLVTFCKL